MILAALVVTQLPQWPYSGSTASAIPAPLRHAIPAGDPVAITYPYATIFHMQPMLWQAENGFDFRLLGGYAYHPAANGGPTGLPSVMKPSGLQQFLADPNGTGGGPFGPTLTVSPALVATTRTSLSDYGVRLVIVDRSIAGSGPVMELFTDALGPATLSSSGFSMWSDWHGRPSHEEFLPHIVTSVVRPAHDATLSGTTLLDAKANAWVPVTKVVFVLTDPHHPGMTISEGSSTKYGWLAYWNTARVPNGTYRLQSIAYDAGGTSATSTSVKVTIKNSSVVAFPYPMVTGGECVCDDRAGRHRSRGRRSRYAAVRLPGRSNSTSTADLVADLEGFSNVFLGVRRRARALGCRSRG